MARANPPDEEGEAPTVMAGDPSASTGPVQMRATIGPYVIDGVIGAGGMGVVYAAHDTKLDRKVALKVLRAPDAGTDDRRRVRLLREARAMARLSHPNVVTVYGADVDAEEIYLAMELVPGTTLRRWLTTPRSWQDIACVLVPIADQLRALGVPEGEV